MIYQNSHICSEMAGEAFFQGLYKYELTWLYGLLGGLHYEEIWQVIHPNVHFKYSQTLKKLFDTKC